MDAFDADVLIYAAVPDHPLGRRVAALLPPNPVDRRVAPAGIGSLLLVPEVLGKPLRQGATGEVHALSTVLSRLDLRPLDRATAELAAALSGMYRLRATDAAHVATAIAAGADRFITNNQKDFPADLPGITVTYPADLPEPVDQV